MKKIKNIRSIGKAHAVYLKKQMAKVPHGPTPIKYALPANNGNGSAADEDTQPLRIAAAQALAGEIADAVNDESQDDD